MGATESSYRKLGATVAKLQCVPRKRIEVDETDRVSDRKGKKRMTQTRVEEEDAEMPLALLPAAPLLPPSSSHPPPGTHARLPGHKLQQPHGGWLLCTTGAHLGA